VAKKKTPAGSKGRGPEVRVTTRRASPRDMSVTLKMSPQEYQLIAYAASKSRARGVLMWMRERLLEAAREKVPEKTVENIIEGRATGDLLRESLKDARGSRKPGRVLEFGGRGKPEEET
jgi:hypothetical protein